MRDVVTDAIRYWEPRRIAYNAILAAIVVAVFLLECPQSRFAISADLVQSLFVLAVLANVAYCSAYVVDVVAQPNNMLERTVVQRGRTVLARDCVLAGARWRSCPAAQTGRLLSDADTGN